MLSKQSWWPQAEGMQEGQRKRVNHDCGEGRTLQLSRSHDGWRAYCHRCGDSGSAKPPAESLAEKVARFARLRLGDESLARQGADALPMPVVQRVSEWPNEAALWLFHAGLSTQEIGALGIYYHPPSDRVVVPVLDGLGGHTFYQARAYQKGRMPKYLGPSPKPPRLLARWGVSHSPTLTEDMLSAIKIGSVAEGLCLFGTHISDHIIAHLLNRKAVVNVWTDPDPAGRKAAAKIGKQLRAYGLTVNDILSTRDPKLHTRDEIKELLCGPSAST